MTDANRRELAERQIRLVKSLLDGDAPPAGFDPRRVRIAGATLLSKRRRTVERIWPELARVAGDDFAREFSDYAKKIPLPLGGGRHDALCFARHLARRRKMPMRFRIKIMRLRFHSIFASWQGT